MPAGKEREQCLAWRPQSSRHQRVPEDPRPRRIWSFSKGHLKALGPEVVGKVDVRAMGDCLQIG